MSSITVELTHLFAVAADLSSEEGENTEYDRAIVEFIVELLCLPMDGGRETVADRIARARS